MRQTQVTSIYDFGGSVMNLILVTSIYAFSGYAQMLIIQVKLIHEQTSYMTFEKILQVAVNNLCHDMKGDTQRCHL